MSPNDRAAPSTPDTKAQPASGRPQPERAGEKPVAGQPSSERSGAERPTTRTGGQQPAQSRRLLSRDGSWWWNGRRWIAAVTEDGLWRWDGGRWQPTVDLAGKRPEDLAATLALLAEDRYGQAGAVLAERTAEWQPDGELAGLAHQAQDLGARLRRAEEALADGPAGRGILGRRNLAPHERRQLEDERDAVRSQYRALTAQIGREAPQPSLKEADDTLSAARLLDERADLLRTGLSEVDEAERMRADAAVAGQKELAAAEEARLKALQEARRAVETAESQHAWRISEARNRLRAVLTPGSGELKAGLGLLRLHAALLETPGGRLPAAGLRAVADSATMLWRNYREPLLDLVLLETPEAESFLTALTERSTSIFLLITGPTGSALWACPPGQENAARRFAAVVTEHAREAAAVKEERDARARKAENELDVITRDRSPVEAAESELARIEADPSLLGAIDDARQRLERARADTPELNDARRKVLELSRRVIAPPEPLRVAT